MSPKLKDIIENVYGRLTVLEDTKEKSKSGHRLFRCRCECGNKNKIVKINDLTGNRIKSCGICSYSDNIFINKGDYYIGITSKGEEFIFDSDMFEILSKYTWSLNNKGLS